MKLYQPLYYVGAEAYGTGTYDCGSFEEGCAAGASTGADGGLVNTGYDVLIPLALAAALVVSAIVLLVTKLIRKRKSVKV